MGIIVDSVAQKIIDCRLAMKTDLPLEQFVINAEVSFVNCYLKHPIVRQCQDIAEGIVQGDFVKISQNNLIFSLFIIPVNCSILYGFKLSQSTLFVHLLFASSILCAHQSLNSSNTHTQEKESLKLNYRSVNYSGNVKGNISANSFKSRGQGICGGKKSETSKPTLDDKDKNDDDEEEDESNKRKEKKKVIRKKGMKPKSFQKQKQKMEIKDRSKLIGKKKDILNGAFARDLANTQFEHRTEGQNEIGSQTVRLVKQYANYMRENKLLHTLKNGSKNYYDVQKVKFKRSDQIQNNFKKKLNHLQEQYQEEEDKFWEPLDKKDQKRLKKQEGQRQMTIQTKEDIKEKKMKQQEEELKEQEEIEAKKNKAGLKKKKDYKKLKVTHTKKMVNYQR